MSISSSAARIDEAIPASRSSYPPVAPSPFVKWVGGKGRLLGDLRPLMPAGVERMRHVEPFIGGGALFFNRQPRRAMICDINPSLINTYTVVRDQVEALVEELEVHAERHGREHYYQMRDRYNQDESLTSVQRAALFIYLNKTCFNGLHRVNSKGHFNVPIGRYTNPRICNRDGLVSSSHALRRTDIVCASFESLLDWARPGDFIYFDPPYAPVSATANFTSYARDGFGHEEQIRLRDVFRSLDRRGCKMMLSNSDVPVIRDLYRSWDIQTIQASRAINSNAKRRGKVNEVVVRNYA